ncbi:type II toxin-antitoxin system Phd/YefM family antitoxin [Natronospirillum operosum]|uniref:Type II toxin-antitoxin system Phd/YefM family antitoxin n=2 Tax=Natronospirillum operosum TaxID=2759953 RepID=A0A4Z0W9I0_9GAMM|nr:type II toxin-antitoxin system Phd/YefM family antitoxin [Natronospirillum operosum]
MKQEHVSKSRFKAMALEYMRRVETSGESVVITDRGQPTVEIRRYRSDRRSPLETLKGSVVDFNAPTDPVAEDDWEAVS